MKDIVIIGAGGFGREVAWLIEEINCMRPEWNLLGFVDDNPDLLNKNINGYQVIGNLEWLEKQELYVVNAIGNSTLRMKMMEYLKDSKNKYPVLVHPNVIISQTSQIEEGSIVCAGNIITVNVMIGKHVIVNLDCTIGHDSIVEDYCTILPSVNISGNVILKTCVNVGTKAALIPGVIVGENSIIGAGSVVIRSLPSNCTAVGVPARIL